MLKLGWFLRVVSFAISVVLAKLITLMNKETADSAWKRWSGKPYLIIMYVPNPNTGQNQAGRVHYQKNVLVSALQTKGTFLPKTSPSESPPPYAWISPLIKTANQNSNKAVCRAILQLDWNTILQIYWKVIWDPGSLWTGKHPDFGIQHCHWRPSCPENWCLAWKKQRSRTTNAWSSCARVEPISLVCSLTASTLSKPHWRMWWRKSLRLPFSESFKPTSDWDMSEANM